MSGFQFEPTLQELRKDLAADGHELSWSSNAAASADEIVACEAAIGHRLPREFRAFLLLSNGCSLMIDPQPYLSPNLDIFSTSELVENQRGLRQDFRDLADTKERLVRSGQPPGRVVPESYWSRLVPFAHYGVGDCLFRFEPGSDSTASIVDLDVDTLEDALDNVIAATFQEWLSRVVDCVRTQYRVEYWLPKPSS